MSEKKLITPSHYLPCVVFSYTNNLICNYFLKEDFSFFFIINKFYDKYLYKNFKKFNKFFLKTYSMHWLRISFRGKGYRLRKFKKFNKVTLNFGHSHWAKLALNPTTYFFKKLKRQNYVCLAKNYYFYKKIKEGFKVFKRLNMYTKRGLRLKKQFIKKRFGKISQVVSSLH